MGLSSSSGHAQPEVTPGNKGKVPLVGGSLETEPVSWRRGSYPPPTSALLHSKSPGPSVDGEVRTQYSALTLQPIPRRLTGRKKKYKYQTEDLSLSAQV